MNENVNKQFIVEPARTAGDRPRSSNKRYIERQAKLALGFVVRETALENGTAGGEPQPIARGLKGLPPLDIFPPLAAVTGRGAAQTEPNPALGAEAASPGIDLDAPDAAHGTDENYRPADAREAFRRWQPVRIFSADTAPTRIVAPKTAPRPAPDIEIVMRRRAIVLDPDADVRRLTACLLRQVGYEVTESESAEDAVASSEKAAADLLVAECRLPGNWTGEALATRLRRTAPNLKVILTSDTGLGAANSNLQVLLKPFGLDQLAALVNQDDRRDGPDGRSAAKAPGDAFPLDLQSGGASAVIAL